MNSSAPPSRLVSVPPVLAVDVEALQVSAGHDYFGHHGKPPGVDPMIAQPAIECVAGCGIRGDRFFQYRENYQGQITFFSADVFDQLRRELPMAASVTETRRNVVLRGIDLGALIGRSFELQGISFAGTEECRPCYWMDLALGPGAEHWLRGRGGLRARILTSGMLRCLTGCELRVL